MSARNHADWHSYWRYAAPMPDMSAIRDQRRSFAEWLRAHMEASGYGTSGDRPGGQSRLAADAGLMPSTLSRALSGQSVPSLDALLRIAKALGVPPADALRAGGFDAIAEVLELEMSSPSGASPDPIAARIEHAAALTAEQRAWLFGLYQRQREQALSALAAEVEDIILFLGSAPSGMAVRVRELADGLTPAQLEQLEPRLRSLLAALDDTLAARLESLESRGRNTA